MRRSASVIRSFLAAVLLIASPKFAAADSVPAAVSDSDYRSYPEAQVKLGQLLFYDRVLSGTYRVSCATCHNHDRASSNGFRLDGETGTGADDLAVSGLEIYDALKPSSKHAPALFNLGATEFETLFSDGRIYVEDGKLRVVANVELPTGLNDVLAAQALFPAVTRDELVGTVDNDIAAAAHLGNAALWAALTKRVKNLNEYWPFVKAAYPDKQSLEDLQIVDIANAIGAFVGTEWRSDSSPFDRFLRGDKQALTEQQKRGMNLFYGAAGCSACHAGKFQTDHKFHFAPLGLWRFDTPIGDDSQTANLGRFEVTGEAEDKFSYRTPSLRNVEKTAPYGQAGAIEKLETAVGSHLYLSRNWQKQYSQMFAAVTQKLEFDPSADTEAMVDLIVDFAFAGNGLELPEPDLGDVVDPVADLTAFLKSLTDENALKGRLGKPRDVPSSLAID